ncbi:BTB/POZ and MATH domain-containing protein 2-like [Triticum dicoccoides]|uniref:BTB/POZ and MATH domain-containing protein 2-like n=1 Tax=Triticum dicoccoides TaxID=85692 RepID=UPI00188E7C1B|nr:BTB/POZ and MATH domain-containing protein 2-like [Triticum dicoccoides]XP_044336732.1 BTB/POZ and MATH domain-containing protein 2-like [Triticum aestivum]
MPFTGVSVITDEGARAPRSSSPTTSSNTSSGYHLLIVKGYSRTKISTPTGECIRSRPFMVGGYLWCIQYYPNGAKSENADFISLYLVIRRDTLERSKYLKDDSFTLRCDIVVVGDAINSMDTATAFPSIKVPPSDMQQHFSDLLLAEEGTDVTFKVGSETIAAHRCVLAARSAVFKAELFGTMKEGTATTSVIQVDDMDAQVFRAMLGFIYSDSPPDIEEEEDADVMWRHLLIAADRYDLRRLRLMCEEKLSEYVDVSTATTILTLAEQHNCRGLKETCLEFLNSPANLQKVMATGGLDSLAACCPSVLKDLIAKLARLKQ